MLFKIKSNPMHSLSGALLLPYVPARVVVGMLYLLSVVGKLYARVLLKELGPELNVQEGRSNVGLGRVEDV